ncbi:MAG: hypothetical protein H7Y11_04780, partial [Armatimonadetes bacterium]|nr:hypothetical protein [Anaerolineae bacterium]
TDPDFDLLAPVVNEIYTDADDLETLSWGESAGAVTYNVLVERTSIVDVTVINGVNLTPEDDSDALTCVNRLCRYSVTNAEQDLLTDGNYRWQVTAEGGFLTPATNGPRTFVIDTVLVDLVTNGGFELSSNSIPELPKDWDAANIGGSKLTCNKISEGKYPAYQGVCSFAFKGALSYAGKLSQKVADVSGLEAGNLLILNVVISADNVQADKAKVVATVKYANDTKEKLELPITAGSYAFQLFTTSATLDDTVSKVKVSISLSGDNGAFVVDNVRLLQDVTP